MNGPTVIKIGGSTLGAADTTFQDVAAMARGGDVPVVVHGGGAEASRWLEAMSIPSRFERGLRVTDERVLPVVVAVFAGLVNKRIVAAINHSGASAVGLSGADGRMVECRLADPALGFVGEPVLTRPAAIQALLQAGIIPVISPVGFVPGQEGDQLVNVNADTMAGEIAAALAAKELVFLTDVEGVRGPGEVLIPSLTVGEARGLVSSGVVFGGMIPKVEACLHAAGLGVPVRIIDGRQPHSLLERQQHGTSFVAAS